MSDVKSMCPLVADLGHATGALLLEEEHLGEAPQNAVSAPHISLQCLQHLRQLTLDPCDLEELSDRDVAIAAGSVLHRDCRLPLQNHLQPPRASDVDQSGHDHQSAGWPWEQSERGVATFTLLDTQDPVVRFSAHE